MTKFYISSAARLNPLLKEEKQSSVGQGASTTPSSTVQGDEMPSMVTPRGPSMTYQGATKDIISRIKSAEAARYLPILAFY